MHFSQIPTAHLKTDGAVALYNDTPMDRQTDKKHKLHHSCITVIEACIIFLDSLVCINRLEYLSHVLHDLL